MISSAELRHEMREELKAQRKRIAELKTELRSVINVYRQTIDSAPHRLGIVSRAEQILNQDDRT